MSWQSHNLNHSQTIKLYFTEFVQKSLKFNIGIIGTPINASRVKCIDITNLFALMPVGNVGMGKIDSEKMH